MSIHNLNEKIKSIYQENSSVFLHMLIIVFVAFGSFFLGRVSVKDSSFDDQTNTTEKVVLSDKQEVPEKENVPEVTQEEGKYVASKNGKIYYPVDCKSASRIKSTNRVYFKNAQDAEYVGYKKIESCQY